MTQNDGLLNEISKLDATGEVPGLTLHSCCAPCGSYVLEYLSAHFNVELLYCNPNIYPHTEYVKRLCEVNRLLSLTRAVHPVRLTVAPYDADAFDALSRGFEYEREGGERCARCIRYRMERAAMRARDTGGKYFGTTLSVSPHKSSPMIHEIGDALEREYGVKYLRADFKKRGGYASSVRRSKMYGLYRQSYCGCRYSIYK